MMIRRPSIEGCSEVVRYPGVEADENVEEFGHIQNRLHHQLNLTHRCDYTLSQKKTRAAGASGHNGEDSRHRPS